MENYVVKLTNTNGSEHCIGDGSGFPYRYTDKDKAEKAGKRETAEGKWWKNYQVIKVN